MFTKEANIEAFEQEILMRDFLTTKEILKYHLKKIGYKSDSNPILEADSTSLKYLSDEDDNGEAEEFQIRTGEYVISTENPNDYCLIIKKNGLENSIIPDGLTKFKFEYFDINGNKTSEKLFIKFIKVTMLKLKEKLMDITCFMKIIL